MSPDRSKGKEVISVNSDTSFSVDKEKATARRDKRSHSSKRKRQVPQDIEVIDIDAIEEEEFDSDVEVVAAPEKVVEKLVTTTKNPKSTGKRRRGRPPKNKNQEKDEEIVEVVGMSNAQQLPHLRPHCTEHPFSFELKGLASFQKNMKHCSLCYCYVCDALVESCANWRQHCKAVDRGTDSEKWKTMRDNFKRDKEREFHNNIHNNTLKGKNSAPSSSSTTSMVSTRRSRMRTSPRSRTG